MKRRDGRRQDEDGREVGGGEGPSFQIGFGGEEPAKIISDIDEIWRT